MSVSEDKPESTRPSNLKFERVLALTSHVYGTHRPSECRAAVRAALWRRRAVQVWRAAQHRCATRGRRCDAGELDGVLARRWCAGQAQWRVAALVVVACSSAAPAVVAAWWCSTDGRSCAAARQWCACRLYFLLPPSQVYLHV
jgi:hypothetical protein